jgi:hypothetical protein
MADENNEAPAPQGGEEEKQPDTRVARLAEPQPLPLDWTQLGDPAPTPAPIRYPHDVAEIFMEDLDILVVGTAGQKTTAMGDDFSSKCNPNLETLVLRSHLIQHMEGLENFTKLELLELYDNQVQELACLESCGPNLRVLDMSYNVIRDMLPVSICVNLQELCKNERMSCW